MVIHQLLSDVQSCADLADQIASASQLTVVKVELARCLCDLDHLQASFQVLNVHGQLPFGRQHVLELLTSGFQAVLTSPQDLLQLVRSCLGSSEMLESVG